MFEKIMQVIGILATVFYLIISITVMTVYFSGNYIRTDILVKTCQEINQYTVGQKVIIKCNIEEK